MGMKLIFASVVLIASFVIIYRTRSQTVCLAIAFFLIMFALAFSQMSA